MHAVFTNSYPSTRPAVAARVSWPVVVVSKRVPSTGEQERT
jgi:hypothetical protein